MIKKNKQLGRIIQIIGPVLDVSFEPGFLPKIYDAITVNYQDKIVTCEVQQLLGDSRVRAVAMSATDGLQRGLEVVNTGAPISVPVGESTLGRIFNILGVPVDNESNLLPNIKRLPIHRDAPKFTELETKPSIFETGIKVVDLVHNNIRDNNAKMRFGQVWLQFKN